MFTSNPFAQLSASIAPSVRWPGYYYRGDHMKLDDQDWHCFTLSQYHKETGEWELEKAPVYHIVD